MCSENRPFINSTDEEPASSSVKWEDHEQIHKSWKISGIWALKKGGHINLPIFTKRDVGQPDRNVMKLFFYMVRSWVVVTGHKDMAEADNSQGIYCFA